MGMIEWGQKLKNKNANGSLKNDNCICNTILY